MEETYRPPIPDTSHLITETDEPVDNVFSEKQMRLLTEPLYASWNPGRDFWVAANVGMYNALNAKAIVPDTLLAMDTASRVATESGSKCYFFWEHGKPPEVVIEIVSNKLGGELDTKLNAYHHLHIDNYIVFDPGLLLSDEMLQIFTYQTTGYQRSQPSVFTHVDLGVKLWEGTWENEHATWLRWCDADGVIVPSGRDRADDEKQRAEKYAAKLREVGIDPEAL